MSKNPSVNSSNVMESDKKCTICNELAHGFCRLCEYRSLIMVALTQCCLAPTCAVLKPISSLIYVNPIEQQLTTLATDRIDLQPNDLHSTQSEIGPVKQEDAK